MTMNISTHILLFLTGTKVKRLPLTLPLSAPGANKSPLIYVDEKDCCPLLRIKYIFFDCFSTASKR